VDVELPEAFLKRWLISANKELTEEQIEQEFPNFILDLKWQLIKDSIGKENEIKVSAEEADVFAKRLALAQFQQYGMYDVPEEQLESFAKMMLEKPEEQDRIYKKLHEDKVLEVVKDKVSLDEQEVSQEEFNKMME
jgi:trigger factor